jgi:hypothetical protein
MTNKLIIGIVGNIGCGKDTIAHYLTQFHDFNQLSFANSLKDAVSSVFGWDREMVEGRTQESREWRETVDPFWSKRLSMPTLTPRWVLQQWGTELARKHFHDDIWIASLENKISKANTNIVISDCRFPNEIQAIRDLGGSIIRVQRGELPDWYADAELALTGSIIGINRLKDKQIHASEWAWLGSKFDIVIDNNGTVDQLYGQVSAFIDNKLQIKISQA